MKRVKRYAAKVLAVAMLLTAILPGNAFAAESTDHVDWQTALGEAADQWLIDQPEAEFGTDADWIIISLIGSGYLKKDDPYAVKYAENLLAYLEEHTEVSAATPSDTGKIDGGGYTAGSVNAKAILALSALGLETDAAGADVAAPFSDENFEKNRDWSLSGFASTDGYLLMALNGLSGTGSYTKEKEWIRQSFTTPSNYDRETGAFGFTWYDSFSADPDTTAMVIQALAKSGVGETNDVIGKALAWLKDQQTATGAIDNWGDNVDSTAQAVLALCALDIDPASWKQDGMSLIDYIVSTYDPETRTFQGAYGDSYQNQAVQALGAYRKYVNAHAAQSSSDEEPYKPSDVRSSYSGSSYKVSAAQKLRDAMNISVTSPEQGDWVRMEDGSWMLFENGMPVVSRWAAAVNPYTTPESVSWFYFGDDGKMLVGWQKIAEKWYYLNPIHNGWYGACYMNAKTPDGYRVGADGSWIEEAAEEDPAASSAGSKNGADEKEEKKTGTVTVSVSAGATTTEGNSISFSASKTFRTDDTEETSAYDLLCALCEAKDWDMEGDGSYVAGINGLFEFDCGSSSGWMYKVNGKIPAVSAGDCEVNAGDKISWFYVTDYEKLFGDM